MIVHDLVSQLTDLLIGAGRYVTIPHNISLLRLEVYRNRLRKTPNIGSGQSEVTRHSHDYCERPSGHDFLILCLIIMEEAR
jgi:hypothetical protein